MPSYNPTKAFGKIIPVLLQDYKSYPEKRYTILFIIIHIFIVFMHNFPFLYLT